MTGTATPQEKQFTITRVFDAPREAVWRAWTDPDETAHWWHPRGITSPREHVEMDVRPGGTYRYVMIDPDTGNQWPTGGTYSEVDPPHRLAFSWGDPAVDGVTLMITVTLTELDGKTQMVFHVDDGAGWSGDAGVYDGWNSAFDVLEEHLG